MDRRDKLPHPQGGFWIRPPSPAMHALPWVEVICRLQRLRLSRCKCKAGAAGVAYDRTTTQMAKQPSFVDGSELEKPGVTGPLTALRRRWAQHNSRPAASLWIPALHQCPCRWEDAD